MIRVAQTPAVNHNFDINFGHPLNLVSPLVSYGTAANWTRSPPSVFRKFFAVKPTRFFFAPNFEPIREAFSTAKLIAKESEA